MGKRAKAQNLPGLINKGRPLQILRRVQRGDTFAKLRVDIRRMGDALLKHGGVIVFGGWGDGVEVCALREGPSITFRPII